MTLFMSFTLAVFLFELVLGSQVSVCGSFLQIVGGTNVTKCNDAACGTVAASNCSADLRFSSFPTTPASAAQLRWGNPQNPNQQSGYGFIAVDNVTIDFSNFTSAMPVFACGQLTHFNYPVVNAGTGFTLSISVTIDSTTKKIDMPMLFNEEQNSGGCLYEGSPACPDATKLDSDGVFLNGETAFSITSSNGSTINYSLQLFAFGDVNAPKNVFVSQESASTTTNLLCRLAPPCPASCPSGSPRSVYLSDGTKVCGCQDAVTMSTTVKTFSIMIGTTTPPTSTVKPTCNRVADTKKCDNAASCCYCDCSFNDKGQIVHNEFCQPNPTTETDCQNNANSAGELRSCTVVCPTTTTMMPTTAAQTTAPPNGVTTTAKEGNGGTSDPSGGTPSPTTRSDASSIFPKSLATLLAIVIAVLV